MLGFKTFITEAATDKNVSALKSYIKRNIKSKITASSRGGVQIRFPFEGDPKPFFNKIGIDVEEYGSSISGKFETYYLVAKKKIGSIPKGTRIPWVNNYIGATKSGGQLFNNKDLNPDNLGLAGLQLGQTDIIKTVSKALESKYEKEVTDQLVKLMAASKTKKTTITIPDAVTFSQRDLAKVSADFGEVLAAIWVQNALNFKECYFPVASNEKLIDIYGIRLMTRYPISVKSGGGGKVTIQNIIDAIKNRAKTATLDQNSESSLAIFKIVNEYSMKEQMIMLHQFMETDAIKKLGEIMGMDYKAINLENLKTFVDNKTNEELVEILEPFFSSLKMKLTEKILFGSDKLRLIISPLGESIWKILNDSKEIKDSLTNIARKVTLIQVNCDVSKRKINFQSNYFKEAKFEFGWAGYAAGNKLGFKMTMVK